jgi:hypothetical protein
MPEPGAVGDLLDAVSARKLAWMALTASIPLAVYFLIPLDKEFGDLLALLLVITVAGSLIPLSFRQARLVLRSPHPLLDAVRCIVTGFVMVIVSFSSAYYVLGTGREDQIVGLETKLDAVYFSVTIMATVGFGDIHATGQLARGIVTWNMVVNFALLAVALRVVSWALKERHGGSWERRLEKTP